MRLGFYAKRSSALPSFSSQLLSLFLLFHIHIFHSDSPSVLVCCRTRILTDASLPYPFHNLTTRCSSPFQLLALTSLPNRPRDPPPRRWLPLP